MHGKQRKNGEVAGLTKKGNPNRSKRQVYRCYWCDRPIKKHNPRADGTVPDNALTREHLLPKSKGGGQGKNIRKACMRCNMERGSDTTWEKGCRTRT